MTTTYMDSLDQKMLAGAASRLRSTEAGRALLAEAGGDEHFALWLRLCDGVLGEGLSKYAGSDVSHQSWQNWDWRGAYDAGQSPSEACRAVVSKHARFCR